ncbi:MAG TPA: zinc ribbon domain-containing protein [Gammaproteobacteria bacterium]|nr:zinc ribbon domain-containing protein [Gammaproteobacteria bacterium]
MPLYEYACEACGERHEALQKVADAPLTDCPACGQPSLRRLISAAGFRLKGGGWYETDFKGNGRKKNLAGEQSGGDTACGAQPDGTCSKPGCAAAEAAAV